MVSILICPFFLFPEKSFSCVCGCFFFVSFPFPFFSFPLSFLHSTVKGLSNSNPSKEISRNFHQMAPFRSSFPRFNRIRIFIICWLASLTLFVLMGKTESIPKMDNSTLIRMSRSLKDIPSIIDTIDLPCEEGFSGNESAIEKLKKFTFDWSKVHDRIMNSTDRCNIYREEFGFEKSQSSEEERQFPLAFAVLAHNRLEQLLLMLSSVYETHNSFCLSIPSNSDQSFIHLVHGLADCFPNMHILQSGPISWGSYAIMRVTYDCMELLYLSGVDAPLRTNLEMVRIMKEWNGLSHVLTMPFQEGRLGNNRNKTRPLRLFKTSLSAIISREAAQVMIKHKKARELIEFLRGTRIADESFWASAMGNPDVMKIPGGFNATQFLIFSKQYSKAKKNGKGAKPRKCSSPPCLSRGFVGRYQTWIRRKCNGSWSNGSCVYGVSDLPSLYSNAAFVAHKLYLDYQPAALICLLKKLKHHRLNPNEYFDARQYNSLPQIEFIRGSSYDNLSRYDLIL
ncbi:gly-16 [Pristionchus pacificus]|nr:gly-16 [Pristionchus pacificus]|eukprot:PDM78001.1 gly-16 [Pristionchus pacificus]